MIFIELLLLLTTFFPIYHLFTALGRHKANHVVTDMENSFSILVPCYNECICINKTIKALMQIKYRNYEVIFINDGSKDNTFSILQYELKLIQINKQYAQRYYQSQTYPNFFCIDKPNTGKAMSLNEGIKFSRNDIIITLDADSILNGNCLSIMNNAFSDSDVVAAGGAIHIMQAKDSKYLKGQSFIKRLLVKMQSIDYLKGFFIYKLSLSRQNALAIISGAFGAFRKSVLFEVGGFRKSLGEDIDITIKIQKHITDTNKKIIYLPHASCYTECPESIRDLYRQRIRWQKGFIDCVIHHSKFLLSTCFKKPISFFLIFEAVCVGIFSCILPMLTTTALIVTGNIKTVIFILMFCTIVNIIYSFFAYTIASKHTFPYKKKYVNSILLDILFMKPFLAIVYLIGTMGYLTNNSDWKKTNRSVLLAKTK